MAIQNARLFHQVEEKGREVEVASRHKSAFLANMSHEVRTGLLATIGFSELLLEGVYGDLAEEQARSVQDILGAGRHVLSLINDAIDLAKVEAGRLELDLGPVALPDVLEQGRTLLKERAGRHRIDVDVAVDPALWQRVQQILTDPDRIRKSPTPVRTYELRGRTKCGVCGASMVGQTLKVKGKPYPYYRCRFAYDNLSGQRCAGRYVRAIDLEDGIWQEVTAVLSRSSVVYAEYEHARLNGQQDDGAEERGRLERDRQPEGPREAPGPPLHFR
jgi:hypothetical protein